MNLNRQGLRKKFQSFLRIWRQTATQLKSETIILIGILLLLWIGGTAYSIGRMSLAPTDSSNPSDVSKEEHNKQIIPFFCATWLLVVPLYLSAIHTRIQESEKKRISIQVPQIDLEYFALMRYSFSSIPSNMQGADDSIWSLRRAKGEEEFEVLLIEEQENYLSRQQIVAELNQALEDKPEIPLLSFLSTIRSACDDVLNKNGVIDKLSQDRFRKRIYAYIRAWLTCSIQYNRSTKNKNCLPIDSIFFQNHNKNDIDIEAINKQKNMDIEAINNLIYRLGHKPVDKFFTSSKSRKVIKDYLGDLINLINDMNPHQDESMSQASHSTETST